MGAKEGVDKYKNHRLLSSVEIIYGGRFTGQVKILVV